MCAPGMVTVGAVRANGAGTLLATTWVGTWVAVGVVTPEAVRASGVGVHGIASRVAVGIPLVEVMEVRVIGK